MTLSLSARETWLRERVARLERLLAAQLRHPTHLLRAEIEEALSVNTDGVMVEFLQLDLDATRESFHQATFDQIQLVQQGLDRIKALLLKYPDRAESILRRQRPYERLLRELTEGSPPFDCLHGQEAPTFCTCHWTCHCRLLICPTSQHS